MKIKIFVAILSFFVLSGCASTAKLTSTPSSISEFSEDLSSLKETYTDIKLYEPVEFSWEYITSLEKPAPSPSLAEVNKKLGATEEKKRNWLEWLGFTAFNIAIGSIDGTWGASAIVQLMFITPNETHTWEKENKRITARIHSSALTGYEKRLAHWEWEEEYQVLSMEGAR